MEIPMNRIAFTSAALLLGLAVTASAQAPVAAGFIENFDAEPTCTTTATAACPLVGSFTNLTTDNGGDWIADIGGTGSVNTGPSVDHTTGTPTGVYLYTETSGSTAGTERIVVSPKLDLATAANPQAGFWYHMFGDTMGTMHVDFIQQINAGTDATFIQDGGGPGIHLINSPTAVFTGVAAGDTLNLSGAVDPQFDGEYVIVTAGSPTDVLVTTTATFTGMGAVETMLTYEHNRTTVDITPPFTDNQDLWQKKDVPLLPALVAGGNAFTGQVAIRFANGTSFTSDAAIDDFEFVDALPDDVGVQAFSLGTDICPGSYNLTATIRNFGTNPQSNIPVTLLINGAVVAAETIAGPLAGGASVDYTFTTPVVLAAPGPFTGDVIANAVPNDQNPTNDLVSAAGSVSALGSIPVAGGYLEDFELGQGGWTIGGTTTTWAFGTPAGAVIVGAASGVNAFGTGNLTGQYLNNEDGFVRSPCFDMTGMADPYISLDVWWNAEFSWDGMNVQYTTDGGNTWTNVGAFGDPNNWYTDNTINGMPGGSMEGWSGRDSTANGSGGWVTAFRQVPFLANVGAVEFRVTFGSDASVPDNGTAFDNFQIFEPSNPFPGSGEDLTMSVAVNGVSAELTTLDVINIGDTVDVTTNSPLATFSGLPYALVADLFTTGGPNPTPIGGAAFPEAHISANALILLDGNAPAAGLNWFLAPISGSTATFAVLDPVFIGNSIMLQSLVLDNSTGITANGFFAITDANILEVQ
jgi:MAM domain, meprin/A5/mu/CARDB